MKTAMKSVKFVLFGTFVLWSASLVASILPIEAIYDVTGATLYATEHNPNGTIWNVTNSDWESYSQSNWAQYAIPMTEQAGSYYYTATPPTLSTGVISTTVVYVQASTGPLLGDVVIGAG